MGGGGGGGGAALLMEKHPLVSSENYDIRMQCHLCNSFDSVELKKMETKTHTVTYRNEIKIRKRNQNTETDY